MTRTAKGSGRRRPSAAKTPTAVRFVDFALRAWREGPYVQVMAHATPAGAMRQPAAVKIGKFVPDDYRIAVDAPLARGAEIGRELARVILPPEVWRLLGESLAGIGSRRDLGLRIRLCLDEDLIDLPWEFLYRPDRHAAVHRTRPARALSRNAVGRRLGRMGRPERDQSLAKATEPVGRLMQFEFAASDDPKWVLAELQQVVPAFRSLPVVPIIESTQREEEVIAHFEGYASVHKAAR